MGHVYSGAFVATRSSWSAPSLPVAEGEACGLLQAIKWMTSLGYDRVLFELDFKSVVDNIHSPGADISELGSIIQECSGIISSFPNFNVKFIRRQANSAAHCLARVALSKSSLHIYHCIPDCISQLIINEMQ